MKKIEMKKIIEYFIKVMEFYAGFYKGNLYI